MVLYVPSVLLQWGGGGGETGRLDSEKLERLSREMKVELHRRRQTNTKYQKMMVGEKALFRSSRAYVECNEPQLATLMVEIIFIFPFHSYIRSISYFPLTLLYLY